mmetsp:Transcript_27948/g.80553  ORF Transcript_27948/g.80553 Transcript_27948/m.80553 type:complete len:219 (+) Transcript_27948:83-739(+)
MRLATHVVWLGVCSTSLARREGRPLGPVSDGLVLIQSKQGTALDSAQPEYAKPHKHSWDKAKDGLVTAGTFINNLFEGAQKGADEFDKSVDAFLLNTTEKATKSFFRSLDNMQLPSFGNLTATYKAAPPRKCAPAPASELQVGASTFLVDNRHLQARTNGVGYRFTKRLSDRDLTAVAHWGANVQGQDEGDGWVRIGDCFLPKMLNGHPVLNSSRGDT